MREALEVRLGLPVQQLSAAEAILKAERSGVAWGLDNMEQRHPDAQATGQDSGLLDEAMGAVREVDGHEEGLVHASVLQPRRPMGSLR